MFESEVSDKDRGPGVQTGASYFWLAREALREASAATPAQLGDKDRVTRQISMKSNLWSGVMPKPAKVHYLQAVDLVTGPPELGRPALTVINARDLAPALAQHERAVLIEDPKMARMFQNLEFWRTVRLRIIAAAIVWVIQQSIAHKYKIELSVLHHWKTETTEGKVILSPMK
jgi:hypothetical protein